MSSQPLADKSAVITGGGRGIGAAVARALAEAGASVLVAARSRDQLDAIVDELRTAGHRAWAATCDVTDPEQIAALKQAAGEHLGGADILVNNAGIATSAPLAAVTLEQWNRMMAVNATGTFLCTQAFLPAMVERGWGRVVNVASVAGKAGAPYISAYAASKHAVVGFSRSIALEVATTGVTVNAVCPGYVETDMLTTGVDRMVEKAGISADQARAAITKASPQQRLFTAEEVAFQVLSLCDPRAGGVNAQAVVLDGGMVQS